MEEEIVMRRFPDKVRTLVLSGGSTKAISILGSIQYLKDRGLLDEVDMFIGTSAGSIISYLYILGYSPVEVMMDLCSKDFLERIISIDMSRLFHGEKAVAKFQGIQDFLEQCTIRKHQRYFTLAGLYEQTGKKLICATYNLTQQKMEYLSPDTHPDLPCITAIRMSSCLPFLFEPFTYMNSVYIDGAVGDDFPISQVITDHGPAIGVRIMTKMPQSIDIGEYNLIDYFNMIITICKNLRNGCIDKYGTRCKKIFTIPIQSKMSLYQISLTNSQKFDLFSMGYEATKAQMMDDNDW